MPRRMETDTEAVNADSFLDIVASVVSIMIIMVLMTGLKIKHTPVSLAAIGPAPVDPGLKNDLAAEQAMRRDVLATAEQAAALRQLALVRQRERDSLAVALAAVQRQTEQFQQQAAAKTDEEAELGRTVASLRAQLTQIQRDRAAIASAPVPAAQVENYPTPLSRVVEGREVHFRLRHNRLAYVPVDTLIAAFKSDVEHKIYRLRDQPEFIDTVGPDHGFRLRYTMERYDGSEEPPGAEGRGGSFARLKNWTLLPVSEDIGEPVDKAIKPNSQFHLALESPQARDSTVTIWLYPDSFGAFREIKKDLYRLGFPVAARPLPDDAQISASPHGSKSVAQ